MIIYSGNEEQYLTRIFLNDSDLQDTLYNYQLYSGAEAIATSLASAIVHSISVSDLESCLSASEIYDTALENYIADKTSNQYVILLNAMQQAIFDVYLETYVWYMDENKKLYMGILQSLIYGSLKHFFYENRHKYLPQYDWYLIEKDNNRKIFVDTLFKEFDKLATVVDSIKNYTDIDEIPDKYLIYLMELIGETVNDHNGLLTDEKIRSMAKNLIETYRYKGALFAFELFFGCIGIDAQVNELYFDRRLFYSGKTNKYTLVDSNGLFEFYLTPNNPGTTNYSFYAGTNPKDTDIKYPISSFVWAQSLTNTDVYTLTEDTTYQDNKNYYKLHGGSYLILTKGTDYTIGESIPEGSIYEFSDKTNDAIKTLLGFENTFDLNTDERFTYFKSNVLSVKFYHYSEYDGSEVSSDELAVYKQLTQKIIPTFMQSVFTNTYFTSNSEAEEFIISSEMIIDSNKQVTSYYGAGMVTNANLYWVEPTSGPFEDEVANLFVAASEDSIKDKNGYGKPSLSTEFEFTAETKGKQEGESQLTFSQKAPHLFESVEYKNQPVDIVIAENGITYKLNNWYTDNTLEEIISNLNQAETLTIQDN